MLISNLNNGYQNKFLVSNCNAFMMDLAYLDVSIDDCEQMFEFQRTEIGNCFTANGRRSS